MIEAKLKGEGRPPRSPRPSCVAGQISGGGGWWPRRGGINEELGSSSCR